MSAPKGVVTLRYAKSKDGQLIEATVSGETATCPNCLSEVVAHCGDKRVHHWHHANKDDCDSFSEGLTAWHSDWQDAFEKTYREQTLEKEGVRHRADVFIASTVVEFQHSGLSWDEIRERENFYGKMIWVFDFCQKQDRIQHHPGGIISIRHCRQDFLACMKPVFVDLGKGTLALLLQFGTHALGVGPDRCINWGYAVPFTKKYFIECLLVPESEFEERLPRGKLQEPLRPKQNDVAKEAEEFAILPKNFLQRRQLIRDFSLDAEEDGYYLSDVSAVRHSFPRNQIVDKNTASKLAKSFIRVSAPFRGRSANRSAVEMGLIRDGEPGWRTGYISQLHWQVFEYDLRLLHVSPILNDANKYETVAPKSVEDAKKHSLEWKSRLANPF